MVERLCICPQAVAAQRFARADCNQTVTFYCQGAGRPAPFSFLRKFLYKIGGDQSIISGLVRCLGGWMTILVIDDDSTVFETIAAILMDDGYLCLTAKNTQEADLVLETVPVHGMTLDLNIPGCAPMSWLEEIAMMDQDLARRTIVVTGTVLTEEEKSRIELAGAGLLRKPFDINELSQSIRYRTGGPAGEERRSPRYRKRPGPNREDELN